MLLWRISAHCTLNGLGGERVGGSWHTAAEGKPIVYLAEHPAVALVESLANLKGIAEILPDKYRLLKVRVAEGVIPVDLETELPEGWQRNWSATRMIGDLWLAEARSALLRVPAVPSPESWNYLLNPLHPEAGQVHIEWCRWITYDNRLFGVREKQ